MRDDSALSWREPLAAPVELARAEPVFGESTQRTTRLVAQHAGAAGHVACRKRGGGVFERLARSWCADRAGPRESFEMPAGELGPGRERGARLGLIVVDAARPARDDLGHDARQPLEALRRTP